MKLVCPKCLSHLKVPAAKVPAGGGWARCPKCAEMFYVQAPGQGLDLLSEAPGAPPARRRQRYGRDEGSQQLLDRLRTQRGEDVRDDRRFDLDLNKVIIFPEPALPPAVYQVIGLALLSLPILALAVIFFKSEPAAAPAPSAAEFKAQLNNEFNPALIRADLLQIRRQTIYKKRLLTQVDFTGSESRVFKYFAANMVPGICDAINQLEIESDRPTNGFSATAVCREGILESLRMQVHWTDRTAVISFPGYSQHDQEVDLFPLQSVVAGHANSPSK